MGNKDFTSGVIPTPVVTTEYCLLTGSLTVPREPLCVNSTIVIRNRTPRDENSGIHLRWHAFLRHVLSSYYLQFYRTEAISEPYCMFRNRSLSHYIFFSNPQTRNCFFKWRSWNPAFARIDYCLECGFSYQPPTRHPRPLQTVEVATAYFADAL